MDINTITRLLEFDTPTVANGLELLGVQDPSVGYTGPDVRALLPELGSRVGIAVTARMDTTTAGTDEPVSLFRDWVRLMREAARANGGAPLPVIAVMESVGPRPRHTVTIGDGMATVMLLAGAAGFLTNGSIRDIDGVRQVGLACWGAGLSPMHGRLRWLDVNSPVVIDGMTVRPGDIIHADANGAIVIPARVADQVYDQALAVRRNEQAFFARLRQPGTTLDTYLGQEVE
jgi:regulator of RNase E activity RraA